MHVCLGGLTLGHESQRLLTRGIVKPRVKRRSHIPARPGPITAQPAWKSINTYLQPVMLPLCIQICLSSILCYQMCIHVWMWVSTHVSSTLMCAVWGCVHRLSEFECDFVFVFVLSWYKLVTAFAWTSLVVSAFFSPELKNLELSPVTQKSSFLLVFTHLTTVHCNKNQKYFSPQRSSNIADQLQREEANLPTVSRPWTGTN